MRTFQFSDANSHKFWNIDVQGDRLTATYGKVGTAGQSQTKTFASADKAQAEADKLIREKTGKGYVETTPKAAASQDEAFERVLAKDPYDQTAWSAYADYLSEKGDPRGEFMQVQRALEDESLPAASRKKLQAREKAILKAHEKGWVGDWPELFPEPTETEGWGQINHTGGRRYEFKRGLLTTVNFGELSVAAARAFVAAPQTRFVRELFVGGSKFDDEFEPGPDIPEDAEEYEAAFHALLRWPGMRQVRRFQFGWISDEVYGKNCHFQCHTSGETADAFVKQMPDLEEMLIFAQIREGNRLFAHKLPRLRVLQLYHASSYPLDALAKNDSLANLTHLLCHPHAIEPGEENAYIRLPHLRAVCRSKVLRSLTHLRLRLADFGDEGVREIVNSGILKRLKVLDLRHGRVTDEGAKLLAACPDLRNLEHLDLSRNSLTNGGVKALRATKVPADLAHQRTGEGGDSPNDYLIEGDYE